MLTHVHTPFKIAGVEIPNRVVRTAHATALGAMNEDLIAYHLARARGGVGLTFIEILSVHPTSPAALNIFDPGLPDRYRRLVDEVRPTGMKLFQQLWHAGHNGLPLDGSPPWSASDIPGPTIGAPPIPMTQAMIDEIVGAYAHTAAQCREWGLDGVEVHCAHGYLPSQFLSANNNDRDDDYGGVFENRARFMLEVVRAVRGAVPKDFPVGVRVAPDLVEGGVGPTDSLRAVQLLETEGLIDFVDISAGNYQSFPKMIGGMHEPTGYEMPTSLPIAEGVKSPRIVTGRFRTLEEADQVIRAGEADLVGLTRAHIADPDLVRKTLAGHPEQVRPCIACNQGCVGNLLGPRRRLGCVVNPAVGFEIRMGDDLLTSVADPRTVYVVGGGPAGLEAARTAALRGHRVILAEAEPTLGGTVKLAARAPTRHGMIDFVSWLEAEVYRLGVEVRLSTYLDAEDILQSAPDAVIIAAGAAPRMDGVQASNPGEPILGMDRPNVISSNDLFSRAGRDWGRSAVVVDDVGHYEGVACAEHLIKQGLAVTYVSRHPAFAPLVETALMTEPALQRLSSGPFTLRLRSRAVSIGDDGVVIGPTYLPAGSNLGETAPADVVVFVSANRPNRELYDALVGRVGNLRIIGDANAPRFLETAVREGRVAGAAIA